MSADEPTKNDPFFGDPNVDPNPAPEPLADATPSLGEELAKLQQELAAAKDHSLRAAAEVENVRKRAKREIEDERRFAHGNLLRDLLPVVDNLDRAIAAGESQAGADSLLAGVKLVAQQLHEVLKRYHCTPIDGVGQPFDPHVHQAILEQASSEHPKGTIVLVAQTGYKVHDRVLRPAQVIVSSGPPES